MALDRMQKMTGVTAERLGYRPELDGLRGVAVLAVVVAHAWPALLPGGWVGVDLFFVLSGYLITRLMIEERDRTGRVDLRAFYRRRVLRLAPALVLLLAVLLAVGTATPGQAATVYLTNWVLAFGGDAGALDHTWSLAVEEQFYLLWPVGFLLLRHRPKVIVGIVAAVVVWRFALAAGGASDYRTYAGFDTRADALLIGCLLAFLPISHRLRWAAVALLVVVGVAVPHDNPVMAFGGYTAVAVAAAVVIAAATGPWAWALSWRPLVRVGRVSYGLYLFHSPIMGWLIARHIYDGPTLLIVGGGTALVAALASYALIERPFLALKRPAVTRQG
jgi:peptidoglycan/LPS O-acetylase OafA/YrhL